MQRNHIVALFLLLGRCRSLVVADDGDDDASIDVVLHHLVTNCILGNVESNHLAVLSSDRLLLLGKNNRYNIICGLGGSALAKHSLDDLDANIVPHHFVPDSISRYRYFEHLAILRCNLLVRW